MHTLSYALRCMFLHTVYIKCKPNKICWQWNDTFDLPWSIVLETLYSKRYWGGVVNFSVPTLSVAGKERLPSLHVIEDGLLVYRNRCHSQSQYPAVISRSFLDKSDRLQVCMTKRTVLCATWSGLSYRRERRHLVQIRFDADCNL